MVSILLPILDKLALSYDIDYHFLIIPVAIAVNFSYAFPAAGKENNWQFKVSTKFGLLWPKFDGRILITIVLATLNQSLYYGLFCALIDL